MRDIDANSEGRHLAAETADYVPFIILSGARTGSNMLAQALNSSPHVTCFREVFNFLHDFVQFDVEGYDNFNETDLLLRTQDPMRFLDERIFRHYPEGVRAVGFKFHFEQFWGFPGLLERLGEDTKIRVLHLERRNLLRSLVSLKIAERTNVWMEDRRPLLSLTNLVKAVRDPLMAASRLRQRLAPSAGSSDVGSSSEGVDVSSGELFHFIVQMSETTAKFDDLFRQHPKLTLAYEDMADRPEEVFGQAQAFLGLEPAPLTVTMRRQNPEPLVELIENYHELFEAYKDSPHAWMFE